MNVLAKARDLFKSQPGTVLDAERGLLLYESVNDVIQAESVLKNNGFDDIRVVAPPPEYRKGCDLSIEFPIIEHISVLRSLEQQDCVPMDLIITGDENMLPTEICTVKEFNRHIMVRAANMKITFEKDTLRIVNISGGGCSDVPYMATKMIGQNLHDAPSPRECGFTLCAYTLAIAFEHARKQYV